MLLARLNPELAIDYITARVNMEKYAIPIRKQPSFITLCRNYIRASKSELPSEFRLSNRSDQEIVLN